MCPCVTPALTVSDVGYLIGTRGTVEVFLSLGLSYYDVKIPF